MRHAVLLTVHDNTSIVKILMKILDDSRFTFYLMCDKKSQHEPSDFIPDLKYAKVRILPRVDVNWGGYSSIYAELLLIENARKDGADYLHYLQGADLPLKNADEIDAFFSQGGIFVDVNPEPSDFAHYKVFCKHWFVENSVYRTNKWLKRLDHACAHLYKPFVRCQKNFGKLYAGSALWSIPAEFAEYVLDHKREIEKMYQHSLAADEVFMQTLLMNSSYLDMRSVHGHARLIDWKNHEGNSPKTFTMRDCRELYRAVQDPNMLFVRKIHENRDLKVAEYIYDLVKGNVTGL